MHRLGLTAAEEHAFEAALAKSHALRIHVDMLDRDEEILTRLEEDVMSGQVNCNIDGQQSRYLQTRLLARRALAFEADGEFTGALHFNRLIRVVYAVKAPAGEWIHCPVFTGPVVGFNRSGEFADIEAAGKERYAQGSVQRPFTIKKGTKTVDAIRTILQQEAGEDRFSFPDLDHRLTHPESLKRDSVPWDVCQKLARAMNRQLYYDAAGVCRIRVHPRNPLFTFRDGDGGTILSEPEFTPDFDGFANRVIVHGGEKKKAKQKDPAAPPPSTAKDKPNNARGMATAPRSHPLSPWRLGRNNGTLFFDHVEDNSHIRTDRKCDEIAQRILDEKLSQAINISFESFPIPHLDVGDRYRFHTREGAGGGLLREFSLPLQLGQPMTVGHRRRVMDRGKARQRRGRRHARGELL